jgi:squalene cyclase
LHLPFLRRKASDFLIDYINAEDSQTKYVDIGPVNKVINALSVWHAYGPNSKQFQSHVDRLDDYLWLAEDGMKMQGYNGSQLWDTAFAIQAILESPSSISQKFKACVQKVYSYLDVSQVPDDVPDLKKYYRHISKGGWPFSTVDHGWPISDCTAEGLSAVLAIHNSGLVEKTISDNRLFDAVNVILLFQNPDGGWATYENTRGSPWLELLNPSDVFGAIMIDYSYVECTSACVRALVNFKKVYPNHRSEEIKYVFFFNLSFIISRSSFFLLF